MEGRKDRKKKITIFRIFLAPLIGIMLIQSIITIGTLVVRQTADILSAYSIGMMNRLVENRKVILQNDMNQRWASVREHEKTMNGILERFLTEHDINPDELLASKEGKNELLRQFFPECLGILQSSSTTGIFLVLTDGDMREEGDYDGFFIRDSDPDTNPANFTDLLLERGSKQLSREWGIPLDTNWTTRFHMDGQGKNPADSYFYEPWRAGTEYADAAVRDLGYWSLPFSLEKGMADAYDMITYSLPLRYEGQVYGVLGVEISTRSLYDYFPVAELSDSQQAGYMLAVCLEEGDYRSLTGKGVLYNLVHSGHDTFSLRDTSYQNLSIVENVRLNGQGIFTVACPLKLYGNNVPYENTEWVLLGLNTEEELFGMSRQLYVWMLAAIMIGLVFGVFGIYFLVRHLTRPVQHLMECISRGSAGLQEFKLSNILEIDSLYDVVNDLTAKQKEAENILLEEKERYRIALESSKDIFFSYNFQSHMLDIVNYKKISGQVLCKEYDSGFINPDNIHEMDREAAIKAMQSKEDKIYAEFRTKWPEDGEFVWVAMTGNVVYDTDGRRWKMVGSIRDIQEQKQKELEQLKRNTLDGVTGFYVFSAGMERLEESRRSRYDGVMVNLFLSGLRDINEKNGIVFGDMILEEIGILLRNCVRESAGKENGQAVALRLEVDEFCLWLEGWPGQQAAEFTENLLAEIAKNFEEQKLHVALCVGLACGEQDSESEELIRRAKLARSFVAATASKPYLFYEDTPKEKRKNLPVLTKREINTLGYGDDVSLVSIALNLFGKGSDFPAQMLLMVRKIGRFYQASDVLISELRGEFNSNYLNYQWHENGKNVAESVRKYKEKDKEAFFAWLGEEEVRYFSEKDSSQELVRCFLSVGEGTRGVLVPMHDNGNYMGNLCILGIRPKFLESPEEYQNLAEIGRVIQSQLNQQQHDIASKAKSEFLSRMSHEIRTPMNGIIGMAAIALQKDQSQERVMDCLQKIQSSSGYLLGLINDILDMSKIESGKMKLEVVNFDMHEMLETVRELIFPQAMEKQIDFAQNIELTHSWFLADKMRISQVLINLLGNAVKFTPMRGKVILTVREVKAEEGEALIYFSVSDTGIGIARKDQEKVFRAFEQSSSIKNPSKQQGTGLGLSISSRLVQMMGSNIQLDSKQGEGSTFSFGISLELGENESAQEQEREISFDGYRILVVEDNELNAEIAQSLLEDRDFQVDCVYDGAQAVERMKNTPPGTYDVILMDIMMPVMDGLEATRAIRGMEREDCHTIPIVAMSANAFDDDLKKSVECGMNGHLSKPVEVDKLYQTLDKVIRDNKKK